MTSKILIRLHTFGKAIAANGAVVILPPIMREYLINYARPLIYSTTLTTVALLSIKAGLIHLQSEEAEQVGVKPLDLFSPR
jgi:8-amino-7-oxononanoate synthase